MQLNTYKNPASPQSRHNHDRAGYNPPDAAKAKTGGGYPHLQPAPKKKRTG